MERVRIEAEWWVDAQGRAVPFGSPTGRFVLCGAGSLMDADKARALGIHPDQLAAKDVPAPPANKAVRGPERNKSR